MRHSSFAALIPAGTSAFNRYTAACRSRERNGILELAKTVVSLPVLTNARGHSAAKLIPGVKNYPAVF
jgi:hypothetical protein